MKAYKFDQNGIYIGSRNLRPDILNGGFLPCGEDETTLPLPSYSQHEIPKLKNGKWSVISDYRGCVFYDSKTKEKIVITEAGVKPNPTWTQKEPTSDDEIYNDSTGEWEADLEQYKIDAQIAANRLCSEIREALFPSNTVIELLCGIKIDSTIYTVENYKKTAESFRSTIETITAEIEACANINDVDAILHDLQDRFPANIVCE